MSDDLVKRWVPCYAEGDYDNPPEMEEDPYGDYVVDRHGGRVVKMVEEMD